MEERKKAALVAAAVLLLTAGWWFFFHTPMQAATERWQAENMKTHAQLIDVQNYKNDSGNLAARQAEQKKRHAFLAKALPDTLEQGAFLSGVERLALADHLVLLGVKPGEALQRDDGLQELPVTVTASGDYFSLLEFLKGLDAQKAGGRFVLVRGLSIQAGKTGEPLTATLSLSVFASARQASGS
ncbi:type 4a pilus biogenesis protein PilO [Selenomonas sp.]|uniref:type 4a pilus biogenesis protein PilO n=1 Tax=Selenomonas sp. TaxID=2053611 RepID=UPI0025DBE36D|nr:type 4a pilus biogenesis protein PilO [Selenomonas sp.]MCI6284565.1 type 4a pilus biogenesis protein PilO [Selenomonas sp.]